MITWTSAAASDSAHIATAQRRRISSPITPSTPLATATPNTASSHDGVVWYTSRCAAGIAASLGRQRRLHHEHRQPQQVPQQASTAMIQKPFGNTAVAMAFIGNSLAS